MFKLFKKHSIQLHKVIIIGIIVFCCAIIISISSLAYLYSEQYYRQTIDDTLNDPYVIKHELEKTYETNVAEIFKKYNNINKDDKNSLENFKNDLLGLTVPDKYRQQHFKLIIALDELTLAGKTENVSEQIDWLKLNTAWLGNLLSQFILNNW